MRAGPASSRSARKVSRLKPEDTLLVFSGGRRQSREECQPEPGGGAATRQERRSEITGIVGRDGGYTAEVADACVIVPTVNPVHTTPHSEAFQAVVRHLMVLIRL